METYTQLVSIPVIIAVIEAIKKAGAPNQYLPVISIGVGFVLGIATAIYTLQAESILIGLLAGVAASGSYDVVKTVVKGVRK